jgi:hypothetical protein
MKDVLQKQLEAGIETDFKMKLKRSQFLVKNNTEDYISVRLGNNDTVSIIGSGSWERVFNNVDEFVGTAEATNIVRVTANKSGLVEVASIDF